MEALVGLEATILAVLGAISAAVAVLYRDLKRDRDRTMSALTKVTNELIQSRVERAECRAKLEALEETVRQKMLAAQPRDSHGRFESEQG